MEPIVDSLANGTINYLERREEAGAIQWVKHPTFDGVYLKHLIKGENTNGQLSCHLVRIDPGCVLKEHIHAGQWELHEVISGAGHCQLDGKEVSYHLGQMTVIPQGIRHEVVAGENGLVLMAKFFPSLL